MGALRTILSASCDLRPISGVKRRFCVVLWLGACGSAWDIMLIHRWWFYGNLLGEGGPFVGCANLKDCFLALKNAFDVFESHCVLVSA